MEKVKITFLGTGNAVPTKQRNHTGILLTYKNENILIDCGEGIQRQFRIAEISPTKITRILITHWHGDHILGLPGLLQTLAMSEYSKTLKIYGPKNTKKFVFAIMNMIRDIKIPIEICEIDSKGTFVNEKEFFMQAEPMTHGPPTNAYSFVIKEKIRLDKGEIKRLKLPNSPLLRQLQEGKDIIFNNKKIKAKDVTYKQKGKKITIIMDTSFNNEAVELAKNSDILISESTFSKEEKNQAVEYKHLTSEDAAMIAKKAKVKKLILTHISQRYEHDLKKIEKEAKKIFKKVIIAKDFDVFEI